MSGDLAALAREALARCDEVAGFTEEPGRVTRTFLGEPMRRMHERLAGWMEEAIAPIEALPTSFRIPGPLADRRGSSPRRNHWKIEKWIGSDFKRISTFSFDSARALTPKVGRRGTMSSG
jgi:hypothetical protein